METARLSRTISRIGYAMITDTDATTGKDTYGPVKLLPHICGGREYGAEPVGDTTSIFADGIEVYAEDNNAGYDISLTTVAVCDAIEEDWYGNTLTSDGVAEYANTQKRPEFALFIYEETTDGLGLVTFFGKCHISNRRSLAGNTKETGAIDPQFPVHTIAARPRWDDGFVKKEIKTNVIPPTVPDVLSPTLSALTIGSINLLPAFSPSIKNYTASTSNATNTITATAADGATVVIKNGNTTVTSGGSATWTAGENIVTITVTKDSASTVYKVVVTKS